jgi:5,5'-dehydrodivanillate O-demethylase
MNLNASHRALPALAVLFSGVAAERSVPAIGRQGARVLNCAKRYSRERNDDARGPSARTTTSKLEIADVDIATTRPGTPGGIFMWQFWHALYRSQDLPAGTAKPIRIMSEDYVLYRGSSGLVQVTDYRCPHRGAPMHLGWIEVDAIRCAYHGWKFDCSGQCIEQPAEEAGFARKVHLPTYPTREHLGLIFGYFGPGAPPPFPHFPHRSTDGLIQVWNAEHVPCNYLQSFEQHG